MKQTKDKVIWTVEEILRMSRKKLLFNSKDGFSSDKLFLDAEQVKKILKECECDNAIATTYSKTARSKRYCMNCWIKKELGIK